MTQIKIVAVPPGQAPPEIRQQWVGITLPVAENLPSKTFEMGVFGGKPENSEGYLVETMLAFRELKKKSPEAADWWSSHISPQLMPWLSFQRSVCEVVL